MNDADRYAEALRFVRALLGEFHPMLPDSSGDVVWAASLTEDDYLAAMNRLTAMERGES